MRRSMQRGAALLIVLWGVTLLAAMAALMLDRRRGEQADIRGLETRYALEAAIETGYARTVQAVAGGSAPRSFSLIEGSTLLRVALSRETGRIDVNRAPPALIEDFLRAAAPTQSEGLRAAEAVLRRRQEAPFPSVSALLILPEISDAVYARIAPHLTVWGAGGIDPAAMSPDMMLLLFPSEEAAIQAYLTIRDAGREVAPPEFFAAYPNETAPVWRATLEAESAGARSQRVVIFRLQDSGNAHVLFWGGQVY